jgi:hypothetical protein
MGKLGCLLLLALGACGPHVTFLDEHTGSEPVRSDYGDKPTWSLTEGVAVALTMTPTDAHVTFTSDDMSIVRVQETSKPGTFVIMPFNPGQTVVHVRGDTTRSFDVTVRPQP